MKLTGSKIAFAAALLGFVTQAVVADVNEPELTTFTAGTPAKASEVNSNFTNLKTFSTEVSNRVTALENPTDDYTLEVTADGVVIGHTHDFKYSNGKPFIPVKTAYGMLTIVPGWDSNYAVYEWDELRKERGSQSSVYYTDAACTQAVHVLDGSEYGKPFLLTKEANTIDRTRLIAAESGLFIQEEGTVFNKTTSQYYNSTPTCALYEHVSAGSITIPVTEVTLETHCLKFEFDTISIDGYVTN